MSANEAPALRRVLGPFDATMVNAGVMIGSAVFLTASQVARALPNPAMQLFAWVCAALFSLAGALTIAELGAAMPLAGGLYVYLREAFGTIWGFLYGWSLFAVIQTAGTAAIAVAFASYAGHFLALTELQANLVASAGIGVLTIVNVLGVREGVVTQNAMTVLKMVLMLGLIVVAFGSEAGSWAHFASVETAPPVRLSTFGAALIGPLFAFDGWITTSYIGGEVKEPGRNLPIAALASVLIVMVLYLALNAAYLYVLGSSGVGGARLVATDTAQAVLGAGGASLVAATVIVSTFGSLNGCILGGARVYYAMAAEGLFFRAVARLHPRFGTPAVSLIAQGAISVALVFTGRFEQLLTCSLFASWFFYALGGIAVFVLRRRADLTPPYRVWGYPVVPAVFVGAAALLLVATVISDPRDAGIGMALLLAGLPLYAFFVRKRAK